MEKYASFAIIATLVIFVLVLSLRSSSQNSDIVNVPVQFKLLPLSRVTVGNVEENLASDRDVRVLPVSVNLFASAPDPNYILDQGIWGSCTAFSTKYAYYFWMNRGHTVLDISPAFTYAESRLAGGFGLQDVGSTNAATVGVYSNMGVVPNASFPYWGKNIFINPSTVTGLVASASNKCTFTNIPFSSTPSTTLTRIKTALQTGGVVVGIVLYRSALTTAAMTQGVWGMPTSADLTSGPVGGHSICLTGYHDNVFTFHNSWGVYCGLGGAFTIPQDYITSVINGVPKYAFDMWTV
jgi:hypothetical protein